MKNYNPDDNLSPRVSALEKGQEALQKDITSLAASVREQGTNLTTAIMTLSQSQNANYSALAEKIGTSGKTDWSIWIGGVTILFIILGALLVPVWVALSYEQRINEDAKQRISRLENAVYKIPNAD